MPARLGSSLLPVSVKEHTRGTRRNGHFFPLPQNAIIGTKGRFVDRGNVNSLGYVAACRLVSWGQIGNVRRSFGYDDIDAEAHRNALVHKLFDRQIRFFIHGGTISVLPVSTPVRAWAGGWPGPAA